MSTNSPSNDPLRPNHTRAQEEAGMPRFIRFSAIVLAFTGVVAFGAIIYSASGSRSGAPTQVPVISADSSPLREKPSEPGGMTVANQDSTIYNMISGESGSSGIERLLPPPEAPVEAPSPVVGNINPPIPGSIPEPRRTDGQLALTPEEIRVLHQERRGNMVSSADAGIEAMNQLTSAARSPSGAVSPTSDAEQAKAKPALAVADSSEPEPMSKMAEAKASEEPAKLASNEADKAAAEVQKIAPAAGAASKPVAVAGANRFVQLGAMKSEVAAQEGWKKLQKSHPSQLGSLKLSVKKVDLGSKGTLWRMRGGPVTSTQAAEICSALKASKTDCMVVK